MSEAPPLCALCGRLLRDPASRARGFGPVCWRRAQPRVRPPAHWRPRYRGRRVVIVPGPDTWPTVPGQTELPLPVQTALTWST